MPAVASLSGAKQTFPAPGAALCPQHQPSPPSPGSQGCGDPTDRLQVLCSPRCTGMVGADILGGGGEVEHISVPALVHPKTPQHTVGLAGGPSMWLLPRLKVPVLTVLGSVCVGWRGEGGLAMGLLSSTDKLYNMSVALNSGQASIRQDGVGGPTQSPVISNGGGMVMEMGDVVLE